MGLKFIIGRAGTGKTSLCIREISLELKKQTDGPALILLVPEQASLLMEKELAVATGLGGLFRAQVLSFKRLAWKIFSEAGGNQKIRLGETGRRILLSKILLEQRAALKTFAGMAASPGMTEIVSQFISELINYRISPSDLLGLKEIPDEKVRDKIYDLSLIYNSFNEALGNNILDLDYELDEAAERVSQTPSLKGAKIWVDGFTGFTPQELNVLKELLLYGAELTVTLTFDPSLVDKNGNIKTINSCRDKEIFSSVIETYQELRRMSEETKKTIEKSVLLLQPLRFKGQALEHIEKYFYYYPTKEYSAANYSPNEVPQQINLYFSPNKRSEVEFVARELIKLARDKKLHWNEMAVLARNIDDYNELIVQEFSKYEIPFFSDYKRPVIHHPLINLLLSVIELIRKNWEHEELFSCLKTGFFPLPTDYLDRLENYCLANGVDGKKWSDKKYWLADNPFESNVINKSRQLVQDFLVPVSEGILRYSVDGKFPVKIIIQTLYGFLEKLKVPETLEQWVIEAKKAGDYISAQIHQQMWEEIINIFDEMITALGEEEITLAEFSLILKAGLKSVKVGVIPPRTDEVSIGAMERSRIPEAKVIFIIGANEGILPFRENSEGLFDYKERELLREAGILLAPKGKEDFYKELFLIYCALSKASEKLYISYSLSDNDGKELPPSFVISRIKTLFPGLKEKFTEKKNPSDILVHREKALEQYGRIIQGNKKSKKLGEFWLQVENWLLNNKLTRKQALRLKKNAGNLNQEGKISADLIELIYGKPLHASVSRLEEYVRCPFAHYAKYGLKLKERKKFELTKPEIGIFFHKLLCDFAKTLEKENKAWSELTMDEATRIIDYLFENYLQKPQNQIFSQSARYKFISSKLKKTLSYVVEVLTEHARQGIFVPVGLEINFGENGELPPVKMDLADNNSMIISGKIDRIDQAVINNQIYIRIIDYKSSITTLEPDRIYHGLSLQLLVYLEAALQGSELYAVTTTAEGDGYKKENNQVLPAGLLYFPIIEPVIKEAYPLSENELKIKRQAALRVKGYLLADKEVLKAMDRNIEDGKSNLLGIKIKQDGNFSKSSSIISIRQFNILKQFLHYVLKAKGKEIVDGNISITPYKYGRETACQNCKYSTVCKFDENLLENKFRCLSSLRGKDFWSLLGKEQLDEQG